MNTKSITPTKYAEKLDKAEKDILKLKNGINFSITKIPISLKGILKKVKITEKDIKMAKYYSKII